VRPRVYDFLARRPRDPNSPRPRAEPETLPVNTSETQREAVAALRAEIDEDTALQRIRKIDPPTLVVGRDRDYNQETFRLDYEFLAEAGKVVDWVSYDHDRHGFVFVQRNADNEYDPDTIQRRAAAALIAWFDRFMKPPPEQSPVLEHGDTAGGDRVFD